MPADADAAETAEWLQGFETLVREEGRERGTYILRRLLDEARRLRVPLPPVLNTPYVNTIALEDQAQYPGQLEVEARIAGIVRWNALAMVVRANRESAELGGHIATYASIADLFEVGFNHFFRGSRPPHGADPGEAGDLVFFQPHASPGVYARAFLEGRLTQRHLELYRQETHGSGLSSYCHPWLMPDFWQFPTGSMGLGPLTAIYQARFMRYLRDRGLAQAGARNGLGTNGRALPGAEPPERRVWAFVGDGEMDEPESLAGLSLAAREGLDNLVFVVNCNLQRLDGPVRGNGSIVQELEGLFAGAGWNVIKLLWGSDWDPLFARDHDGVLVRRLHETVDGEFQKYAATDGRFNREHFFNKYPELQALVAHLTDDDIDRLKRGGHDAVKIHAAYHAAIHPGAGQRGRPTVILAQTKKGYGMGHWGQGKMGSHQQKKLDDEALLAFRERFALPMSEADVVALKFCKPADDSPEMRYLHARREALGGYLPARRSEGMALPAPAEAETARLVERQAGREQSTTMVFVAQLTQLLRDAQIGRHIVPIVADEARTFGMQSLFREFAIYAAQGQLYEPEDRDELLYYKESQSGQILEEGISEAGALSSWIAAATAYSAHGVPMLPFYIFYSCFGFQRVGDLIHCAADSRARGFLVGATAGRTTLSGEGLQHQDGTSLLAASTVPNCRAWDPAFGYELVHIVAHGVRRMLQERRDEFHYITVMNENVPQPPMPAGVTAEMITSGLYKLPAAPDAAEAAPPPPAQPGAEAAAAHAPPGPAAAAPRVRLVGSGMILHEVIAAAALLRERFEVEAEVWSATSFVELARQAREVQRATRLKPAGAEEHLTPVSHVEACLGGTLPVVAATDYVRAAPQLVAEYVGAPYTTLGTDGFGRSATRRDLRRFFEVDREHIALAALTALADIGAWPREALAEAVQRLGIAPEITPPWMA
ncbi:MAG: pyruvate dehydrogenase (acetyl-transferring), homodimeric type [Rubrivivax sp.]|nr:pyruvate dehydrogenase (acetyl-transferring), homodimeric type [Rubrivivax sp.]